MERKDLSETVHRIEVTDLDRHAAEALYLELRRLARQYGVEISDFRVEKSTKKTSA